MRWLTRRRLILLGVVAAFVAAFAVIGALSSGSSKPVTTTAAATKTAAATTAPGPPGGGAPSATWYWTMSVSPSDPDTVVLATSGGLYRSTDGGETWKPTGPKGFNATSVLQVGERLLAGGVHVGAVASPVVVAGGDRTAGNGPGVLVESTDDGVTWKPLHPAGLPGTAIQALALDPAGKTLYAVMTDRKLFTSADGGTTFRLASARIGAPPWALAVTEGDQFLAGDMDTGAYRSANGQTWQHAPFTDSRGGKMVMEYAVKPDDATTVLMSAFGLELSTDGGKTWHHALRSNVMFGPVAWAPSSVDVAYAVGFDGSVWRSGDGGKTWKKVP